MECFDINIAFINFDKNSKSHIAIYSLTKPKVCDRKSKASVKLIVRATAVGLQAKFDANLARHASALYDYGRTHTSRMHLQWLFNVHNSLQVLHARIINERCSCASKEFTVTYIKSSKNTQNQNQTNKYVLYHFKVGGIEEHTGQEGSRYQSIRFLNIFLASVLK